MRRRELPGASDDDAGCQVKGCDNAVKRSLPRRRLEAALSLTLTTTGRRVRLCRDHYREFKKATRAERKLEQLGR